MGERGGVALRRVRMGNYESAPCLSDGCLRVEFNVHIARNNAMHESLFGAVENHDYARILELYCDWFSCWAGEKLGQF